MESTVFDSFKSCMNSSLIMPHSTLSFSIQILGFLKITTNKNVGIFFRNDPEKGALLLHVKFLLRIDFI